MNDRYRFIRHKRVALVVIGVSLLALLLWMGELTPIPDARAQSPLPTAETVTPTSTPFGTGTPELTPSPTPTLLRRTINEVTEPKSTDAIFGWTDVIGTALVDSFQSYDVHISQAGMEDWQWLTSSIAIVHDSLLYRLDTTQFPDGFYDLRVRAIAGDGSFTESFVRGVEIRNAHPPTLTPDPSRTAEPLSPLPTPTPVVLSRVEGGQGFFAPDNGAVLAGEVTIRATVNGTREQRFERFELAISPSGLEKWTWLYGGQQQVWQNRIYDLDTTQYPDGRYDLRLRIVYDDGNYNEYFLRNLTFANSGPAQPSFSPAAGIITPRSGARASGTVDFTAIVPATNLLRWELSWSPGQREQWTYLVGGDQPAQGQVIASLDLSQLPAGQYDFRLRVVRSDYNYTDYYVRDLQLGPGQ